MDVLTPLLSTVLVLSACNCTNPASAAVFAAQCCLASDSGREAAVAALASCPAALWKLTGLMGSRSKVLAAAAGVEEEGQELVCGAV
jgi:hypothetical protein